MQPDQKVGGGRFTLVKPLGRGGMGEVWLAHDERLHEPVALKFLPSEIRSDAKALDELRRETARSHKLTHPNIVRIHDFHEFEGEPAFIAMEYVDGPTLSALQLQQPSRVLGWDFLSPLVQQLCAALEYAHGENVVHRDLKPANIMLDGKGRLKLTDFGIAATMSDSVSRVSQHHASSGTLPYMSPQQLAGKRPQVGDDIYSFGATLYELLSSQPPFFSGDITHQVLNEAPEALGDRLAALGIQNYVSGAVAALIMACLAKDPAQRPQNAGVAASWLGGDGFPAAEASSPGLDSMAQAEQRPISAAVIGIAIIAALLVGGGWYWISHRASRLHPDTPRSGTSRSGNGANPTDAIEPGAFSAFKLARESSVPFAGTLPGTIWLAKDSEGESFCLQFQVNGVLSYEAGRGIRPNGNWQQDEAKVSININDGFTILSGTISGSKIQGKALSRNGKTWTWEAVPKS